MTRFAACSSISFRVGLIVGVAVMLWGCPSAGFLFSKQEQFRGSDSLVLDAARPDILDVIAEVGKSMGYSVSAFDKQAGRIDLTKRSSGMEGLLIGKISHALLSISAHERRVDIRYMIFGNFGTGGQEAATKYIDEFKANVDEFKANVLARAGR